MTSSNILFDVLPSNFSCAQHISDCIYSITLDLLGASMNLLSKAVEKDSRLTWWVCRHMADVDTPMCTVMRGLGPPAVPACTVSSHGSRHSSHSSFVCIPATWKKHSRHTLFRTSPSAFPEDRPPSTNQTAYCYSKLLLLFHCSEIAVLFNLPLPRRVQGDTRIKNRRSLPELLKLAEGSTLLQYWVKVQN